MNSENWTKKSQKVLFDGIKSVKAVLKSKINSSQLNQRLGSNGARLTFPTQTVAPYQNLNPDSSALGKLCDNFQLSQFEYQTLLLVAGTELMPSFRTLVGQVLNNDKPSYPTLNLAIKLFGKEKSFDYFFLSNNAPLRVWELIRFKSGINSWQFKDLEMDERILYYLLGYSIIDKRLEDYNIFPVRDFGYFSPNTKSLQDISVGITAAFERAIAAEGENPLIQLYGSSLNLKQQILLTALEPLELPLYELPWLLMPTDYSELRKLELLWTREVMLSDSILLLDCESIGKNDTEQQRLLSKFLKMIEAPIIVSSSVRLTLSGRYALTYEIPDLEQSEQRELWQNYLGEHAAPMTPEIESIVANFQLTPQEIYSAAHSSMAIANSYEDLGEKIWTTCRDRARPKLDELASRIEPSAGWSDLILPNDRKEMLREMIAQVRHRTQVFEKWKFKKKNNRGLGLCALFAGTSGTGKTMAAEVLAMELKLDLYRIDLSTVVSKYIGETEKNLGKLFDAAESGGVILLFDEGDALFGKRTEASDSKDRYANMEVSYLLQRIESYNGLAIVTTNIEDSLDSAFMRRLRYIIKFPFPGPNERAAIWKRVYPEGVLKETHPRVYQMLGQMEISGGLIYSIALKSAFIAADRQADGVYIDHIHQAAKSEYSKIGRVLSVSETPWIRSV